MQPVDEEFPCVVIYEPLPSERDVTRTSDKSTTKYIDASINKIRDV